MPYHIWYLWDIGQRIVQELGHGIPLYSVYLGITYDIPSRHSIGVAVYGSIPVWIECMVAGLPLKRVTGGWGSPQQPYHIIHLSILYLSSNTYPIHGTWDTPRRGVWDRVP